MKNHLIRSTILRQRISLSFVVAVVALLTCPGAIPFLRGAPNIILFYMDDLGYGDIGPFGSTINRTPHLDQLAAEGRKLTSFYGAPVCTPSRSALMTGCYPPRVGMGQNHFPGRTFGIHPDELTLPELLKEQGYTTHMLGKWHLGDQVPFLPAAQGFDTYLGIPGSNNFWEPTYPPMPLIRNTRVVDRITENDQQRALTRAFTEEAVRIILEAGDTPFFLYVAHIAVHLPLRPGYEFLGGNPNGPKSDWIEEVDWGVGEVMQALRDHDLDDNTVVIFASDNGGTQPSQNQPLRGVKSETLEGGIRTPFIAWYPAEIPPGSESDAIVASFDLLPTLVGLAGGQPPQDRIIDGRDLWPLVTAEPGASPPHDSFAYYRANTLEAVRSGPWKLFVAGAQAGNLYNLDTDIHEDNNVYNDNPDIVAQLTALANAYIADVNGTGARPAGNFTDPLPLINDDGTVRPDAIGATFAEYMNTFFKPAERVAGLADPLQNSDGDHNVLLLEYLFRTNPTIADKPAIQSQRVEGNQFVMEFGLAPVADFSVSYQASDDLVGWNPAEPIEYEIIPEGIIDRHVLTFPLGNISRFWRLQADPVSP